VSRLVQGGYDSGSTALATAMSPAADTPSAVLDKVTKCVVNRAVSFPQALTSSVTGHSRAGGSPAGEGRARHRFVVLPSAGAGHLVGASPSPSPSSSPAHPR